MQIVSLFSILFFAFCVKGGPGMDQLQREKNTAVLEWFDALILAFTLALILLLFVFRTSRVSGVSMEPTLYDGEQLVARSFLYEPARGDVVVVDGYTNYGEPLVKRVIALGGDTVDINFETGDVFVNGELLSEPYISAPTIRAADVQFPVTVPQGTLFVLGDNRPRSKDSRYSDIGFIDRRDILGEVVLRMFPLSRFGPVS